MTFNSYYSDASVAAEKTRRSDETAESCPRDQATLIPVSRCSQVKKRDIGSKKVRFQPFSKQLLLIDPEFETVTEDGTLTVKLAETVAELLGFKQIPVPIIRKTQLNFIKKILATQSVKPVLSGQVSSIPSHQDSSRNLFRI
jgi:23S rRNA A2030 N6-methylase RlmJ